MKVRLVLLYWMKREPPASADLQEENRTSVSVILASLEESAIPPPNTAEQSVKVMFSRVARRVMISREAGEYEMAGEYEVSFAWYPTEMNPRKTLFVNVNVEFFVLFSSLHLNAP